MCVIGSSLHVKGCIVGNKPLTQKAAHDWVYYQAESLQIKTHRTPGCRETEQVSVCFSDLLTTREKRSSFGI